jgi:hypothetical protein
MCVVWSFGRQQQLLHLRGRQNSAVEQQGHYSLQALKLVARCTVFECKLLHAYMW